MLKDKPDTRGLRLNLDRRGLVCAGVAIIISAATLALAHSGATGVVKERMELMEGIGDAMKILADTFKGKRAYDAETVRSAALEIHNRAGEKITRLFPENSLDKPSEALPDIWENWEEFKTLAGQAASYSEALAKAADNPGGPGDSSSATRGGTGRGALSGRGQDLMMGRGRGAMMGGQRGAGPDPEHLAQMPPRAAFMHLADTCNDCHTRFRVEE